MNETNNDVEEVSCLTEDKSIIKQDDVESPSVPGNDEEVFAVAEPVLGSKDDDDNDDTASMNHSMDDAKDPVVNVVGAYSRDDFKKEDDTVGRGVSGGGGCCGNKRKLVLGAFFTFLAIMIALILGVTLTERYECNLTESMYGNSNNTNSLIDVPENEKIPEDEGEDVIIDENITKNPIDCDAVDDKREWPELVGMLGSDAETFLKECYDDKYNIMIVPVGSYITMVVLPNRLVLWVDEDGIIAMIPHVG